MEPAFDMNFGTVILCHVAKKLKTKFKMATIQMMMSLIMSRFTQIIQNTAKMGVFLKLRLLS